MATSAKRTALSRKLFTGLFLLMAAFPLLAEDMWEGVFAYQKKMADYGHPEAQVKLGEMYEHGNGTEQDYAQARQWYQKAADQGFDLAKEKLTGLDERRQRAEAAAQRAEQQRLARQKALEREKAEQAQREREAAQRQAREAEQKRLSAERAAQEAEEKARKADEKARRAEEKRLARKRAQEAMKKMMATPEAYAEE